MPSNAILIVGGGGHAVVVADTAAELGLALAGFLDDDPDAPLSRRLDRIGSIAMIDRADFVGHRPVILAMGDLALRRRLMERLPEHLATIIHPTAFISASAHVGVGVFIGPGAIIHAEATIADHAIINSGVIVEHHCRVAVNAHLAPGVTLGGDVRVGEDTLVGLGSSTLPGVRIGDRCTVGAGSAVIQDLPDGRTAVGVPAREIE